MAQRAVESSGAATGAALAFLLLNTFRKAEARTGRMHSEPISASCGQIGSPPSAVGKSDCKLEL